ncbi:Parafibromin [Trichinella britovi]|uniref:Parafibromin n=1 Tax=Trichinella britovi TaxID=45882 RepID=A0A0V1DA16_TRIBR|nr:Parafibromin [Trichinella britovi]
MADPLKFFRDYILNNRPIVERDEYIIFGDTAFNKDAKTNYLVWNKKDEYYTVGSLWFFYKNRELLHTTYVKEAVSNNVQIVTRPDRKTLEEYLTNEKFDRIPANVDLSAPIPQSIPVSRLTSLADAQAEAKRPRVEDEEQARKDKERLMAILDRGTSMSVTKPDTIRDLSKEHGLTAEKIAALRSKALARKRTQIKNTEEEIEEPTRTFVESDQLDAYRDIISRERTYRTRTTVMQSSVNLANQIFGILERMKIKENRNRPQPAVAPEAVEKHRAGYSRYAQERFRKEDSAKVISNAIKPPMKRDIFNCRFVSSAEKRAAGVKREPEVLIQRCKEGGVTVPYRIVDNPMRFLPEEWDRVVAVFAQGPAWQFKNWPLGATPTDIFSKVKAFHLTWDDDKLDNNISQWAVDVMALSRTKRHLDRAIFQKFWEGVERCEYLFLSKFEPILAVAFRTTIPNQNNENSAAKVTLDVEPAAVFEFGWINSAFSVDPFFGSEASFHNFTQLIQRFTIVAEFAFVGSKCVAVVVNVIINNWIAQILKVNPDLVSTASFGTAFQNGRFSVRKQLVEFGQTRFSVVQNHQTRSQTIQTMERFQIVHSADMLQRPQGWTGIEQGLLTTRISSVSVTISTALSSTGNS